MNYINLNGKVLQAEQARLPVDNGAFRYGYGLFETIRVDAGAVALGVLHWERLFDGLKLLHLHLPKLVTAGALEEQVLALAARNGMSDRCRVRLQVYAGGGGLYGAETGSAGWLIETFALEENVGLLNENGLVMGIATGLSKSADSLANLKSCNALVYAMAARQAKDNKWNDAFVYNANGNIIESTIGNVFWFREGILYTPPLNEGCVAGVMRRWITERVPVMEKPLTKEALMQADEVFVTNAVRRMRWVGAVGARTYVSTLSAMLYEDLFR